MEKTIILSSPHDAYHLEVLLRVILKKSADRGSFKPKQFGENLGKLTEANREHLDKAIGILFRSGLIRVAKQGVYEATAAGKNLLASRATLDAMMADKVRNYQRGVA